jgi:hypothetical protein
MIVGADGRRRAATVRVSKKGRTSTLNRPIQHPYPLETVSRIGTMTEEVHATEPQQERTTFLQPSRPTRSAAARAHDRILAQAISGCEETI